MAALMHSGGEEEESSCAMKASALTIKKGEHIILQDASLCLERGLFAALVGPSGCGKTSLLRVLALLDKPLSGFVRIWGMQRDYAGTPLSGENSPYPRLTYVPQTLALWPHLTVRENLLFAVIEKAIARERLEVLCRRLDIAEILDRKPEHASQGQRQRAALIRALLLGPEILLLDEMTAALDGNLASTTWELLRDFARSGGIILASTHDTGLAMRCDRSYRISDSTIKCEGSRQ